MCNLVIGAIVLLLVVAVILLLTRDNKHHKQSHAVAGNADIGDAGWMPGSSTCSKKGMIQKSITPGGSCISQKCVEMRTGDGPAILTWTLPFPC